jgi:hypothetical protein
VSVIRPEEISPSTQIRFVHSFKLLESESALAFMDVGPIAKGRESIRPNFPHDHTENLLWMSVAP